MRAFLVGAQSLQGKGLNRDSQIFWQFAPRSKQTFLSVWQKTSVLRKYLGETFHPFGYRKIVTHKHTHQFMLWETFIWHRLSQRKSVSERTYIWMANTDCTSSCWDFLIRIAIFKCYSSPLYRGKKKTCTLQTLHVNFTIFLRHEAKSAFECRI
jgi:hypothetical protein